MCSNNTTSFDDRANDDADRHAQMMQEQREIMRDQRDGWEIIKDNKDDQ